MANKRKDTKGRNLKDCEDQMPDGRYRYRYTDKSGQRKAVYSWKLTATDKVPQGKRDGLSLRQKEKEIEKDLQDGIDSSLASNITMNDMFDSYIHSKKELKNSTKSTYLYLYDLYIRNDWGKRKIVNIKYSDVKALYNGLIDNGINVSTVDLLNTILHPVFTLAVRDNIIRKNPSDGIIGEVKKAHCYQKNIRHSLTIEQQTAFIDFLNNSRPYQHWLPLFTTLLGTGCRIGELLGLRWCDCDFKNNTISINHTLLYKNYYDGKGYNFHISTPKSESGCRTIPMLDEVKKAIIKEKAKQFQKSEPPAVIDGYTDFIFTTGKNVPHTVGSVNEAIKRIVKSYNAKELQDAQKEKRNAILLPNFSAHVLRHTFCTRFCENESNIKVIQEIMGHANISTTMDIYAEATEQKKQDTFKNLQGKIKIS